MKIKQFYGLETGGIRVRSCFELSYCTFVNLRYDEKGEQEHTF